MSPNPLVIIPTYNEKENVPTIYQQLRDLKIELDLLFVDDHSPDGTGKLIDQMAKKDLGVVVLHRLAKLGIGSAHKAGLAWAYKNGYETVITMDCDLTHSPKYLRQFLKLAKQADVVVGSRYMHRGGLKDWNLWRRFLTYLGHFLTQHILRMPYDATGAFRLYQLKHIHPSCFNLVQANGYSFLFESLYILHLNGYRIKELSITLPARTYGHSKMSGADIWRSFKQLLNLFLRKMLDTPSLYLTKAKNQTAFDPKVCEHEWDLYGTLS